MKMQERERWDPSLPAFITAVLRTLLGLGLLVSTAGALLYPVGKFGLLSGALLAVALYLIAMRAGHHLLVSRRYNAVMLLLLGQQALLWLGMAILLAFVKVNPVGFVLGVSILPAAIVLTLIWYSLQKRRLPS